MKRTLSFLLLFAVSQIGLFGKVFHVYSPSSKENALWVVKATPQGEGLKLEASEKYCITITRNYETYNCVLDQHLQE